MEGDRRMALGTSNSLKVRQGRKFGFTVGLGVGVGLPVGVAVGVGLGAAVENVPERIVLPAPSVIVTRVPALMGGTV